jgi:hypothetical protein
LLIKTIRIPPRERDASPEAVRSLADSIRVVGLLQPIVVRKAGNGYDLVAGLHRLMACTSLGWVRIPVVKQGGAEPAESVVTHDPHAVTADPAPLARLAEIDENLCRVDIDRDDFLERRVELLTSIGYRTGAGGRRHGAGAPKTPAPKPGAEKRREQRNRPAGATNQNDNVSPNPSAAGPASVQERRAAAREHDSPGRPATVEGDAKRATASAAQVSQRTVQRALRYAFDAKVRARHERGLTTTEIADELSVAIPRVCESKRRLGIPDARNKNPSPAIPPEPAAPKASAPVVELPSRGPARERYTVTVDLVQVTDTLWQARASGSTACGEGTTDLDAHAALVSKMKELRSCKTS